MPLHRSDARGKTSPRLAGLIEAEPTTDPWNADMGRLAAGKATRRWPLHHLAERLGTWPCPSSYLRARRCDAIRVEALTPRDALRLKPRWGAA